MLNEAESIRLMIQRWAASVPIINQGCQLWEISFTYLEWGVGAREWENFTKQP